MTTTKLDPIAQSMISCIENYYGIDLSGYPVQIDGKDDDMIVTVTGLECYSQHMDDSVPHKNPSQGSVEIFIEDGLPTMIHRQWTELLPTDWLRTDEVALETTSPGGGYTHTLIFRKQNHAVFSGF